MAMFGSFVCTYVAKKANVGHEAYRAQAAVMEDWVVKTLDLIPEQATAHNLLGRACTPQENNSHFSLLNLAMLLGMKRVMAQRYSQSLIDDNWRGLWPDTKFVLPAHFSYFKLLLWALVPITNPAIMSALRGRKPSTGSRPITIFSAFARALAMHNEEEKRAAIVSRLTMRVDVAATERRSSATEGAIEQEARRALDEMGAQYRGEHVQVEPPGERGGEQVEVKLVAADNDTLASVVEKMRRLDGGEGEGVESWRLGDLCLCEQPELRVEAMAEELYQQELATSHARARSFKLRRQMTQRLNPFVEEALEPKKLEDALESTVEIGRSLRDTVIGYYSVPAVMFVLRTFQHLVLVGLCTPRPAPTRPVAACLTGACGERQTSARS
jgi:hypothetical protein